MTVGENDSFFDFQNSEEIDIYKDLAKKFVENIIKQATEEVIIKLKENATNEESLKNPKPPSIQIDLVASNTPSPDDSLIPWASNSENRAIDDDSLDLVMESKDTNDECNSETNVQSRYTEEELQGFALQYVKEIIAKATALASERAAARQALQSDLSFSGQSQAKVNDDAPWYTRLRQLISRLMRNTCLCKSKNDRRADL